MIRCFDIIHFLVKVQKCFDYERRNSKELFLKKKEINKIVSRELFFYIYFQLHTIIKRVFKKDDLLPFCRLKYVQFLIFKACSYNVQYAERLLTLLTSKTLKMSHASDSIIKPMFHRLYLPFSPFFFFFFFASFFAMVRHSST